MAKCIQGYSTPHHVNSFNALICIKATVGYLYEQLIGGRIGINGVAAIFFVQYLFYGLSNCAVVCAIVLHRLYPVYIECGCNTNRKYF